MWSGKDLSSRWWHLRSLTSPCIFGSPVDFPQTSILRSAYEILPPERAAKLGEWARPTLDFSADGALPFIKVASNRLSYDRDYPAENTPDHSLLEIAVDIVSAYISKNSVPAGELPSLIRDIHASLARVASGVSDAPVEVRKEPPVSIKKSLTADFIICLEDGMKFKSLKRHLAASYGLTPQEYRSKWGLPPDYPMVAPKYSSARSELAKQAGLGRKAKPVAAKSKKAGSKKAA